MKENDKQEIERLIAGKRCPEGFRCYEAAFDNPCKAKDVGCEERLECLSEDPPDCVFLVSSGSANLCRCYVRAYVAGIAGGRDEASYAHNSPFTASALKT